MSEQAGSIGTMTNGNHPAVDAQPTSAGGQISQTNGTRSLDQRLDALMQTIRAWDWRSDQVAPDPPCVSEPDEPLASAQITTAPTSDRGCPDVPPPPRAADALYLTDPRPRHAKAEPLPAEQPVAPVPSRVPSPPETPQDTPTLIVAAPVQGSAVVGSHEIRSATTVAPPSMEQPDATLPTAVPSPPATPQEPPTPIVAAPVQESAVVGSHEILSATTVAPPPIVQPNATLPTAVPSPPEAPHDPPTLVIATPVQEPAAASAAPGSPTATEGVQPDIAAGVGPHPEFLERKSRPWNKPVLLCVAGLVVVLLVIGAIRLISDKNQGSGPSEPSPTTGVTQPTTHTAASAYQAPLPIPSAALTQYEQYAQSLNEANITATKGLTSNGAALTVSEVVPVATNYATALNTYSLALAYVDWPASLETAVKADQAQLVIMSSYLKSIDAVSTAGLNSWLAQLRAQATTTETMDNALRQELDLSRTTTFPT